MSAKRKPEATPGAADTSTDRSGVRQRELALPQPRELVLIVDDDPLWRAALVREVRALGYDVLAVEDPQLALAMTVRERPTVLLLDHDMPVMTGAKLARLVALALGEAAPICVLCTGAKIKAHWKEDFYAVLSKPIESWQLAAVLDVVFGQGAPDPEGHGG